MIINLFSIFDPFTFINFSLNWLRRLIFLFLLPRTFWINYSRLINFWFLIFNLLNKEFLSLLNKKVNIINFLILLTIFLFIFFNNFIGLFPYIFTSSTHIRFSFSLSFNIWLIFILFGWINFSFNIFFHLTPQNTPFILIPFIVIIESIRNIIRPLTLSIRLSANIIAGHLLITLINDHIKNLDILFNIFPFFIQLILIILEISVSIIQSYVFSILITLYLKEIF